MSEKILSVSIAAYNVEKYLGIALDSIVACPLADEVETIVVNDGSKDGTLSIAKDYARRYPNVVRVIDKENGGYGSTINASIQEASGKYYRLLDGDDWFDSDELAKLVRYLETAEADAVVTKYRSVRGDDEKDIDLDHPYDGVVYPIGLHLKDSYSHHMMVFRTSVLRPVLSMYPITEHANYTDMEYLLKAVTSMKSIAYYDANVYRYRLGRKGQSVELESWFSHIDIACSMALVTARYYEQLVKPSELMPPGVKDWAYRFCTGNASYKCKLLMMMGLGKGPRTKLKHFLSELSGVSLDVYRGVVAKYPGAVYAEDDRALRYAAAALPSRAFSFVQSLRGR